MMILLMAVWLPWGAFLQESSFGIHRLAEVLDLPSAARLKYLETLKRQDFGDPCPLVDLLPRMQDCQALECASGATTDLRLTLGPHLVLQQPSFMYEVKVVSPINIYLSTNITKMPPVSSPKLQKAIYLTPISVPSQTQHRKQTQPAKP